MLNILSKLNPFAAIRRSYYKAGTAMTLGMMGMLLPTASQAGTANTFNTVAENIITGIEDLPGLITGIAYMVGVLLGALGIMKIKDHVENPTQTPLKDGAIRLAAGGALFTLPIVLESMQSTIDQDGSAVIDLRKTNQVEFALN